MEYSESKCISEHANPPLNLGIRTDFAHRQKAAAYHLHQVSAAQIQ